MPSYDVSVSCLYAVEVGGVLVAVVFDEAAILATNLETEFEAVLNQITRFVELAAFSIKI